MEKKYIIKLKENEIAYKTVNSNGCPMIGLLHTVPYIEPDLEQVRKEAYEEGWKEAEDHYEKGYDDGYDTGLSDAWDAARKISSMNSPTRDEVFGLVITSNIFDENTASEAIEKIRQYEQGKEEIKVGDVVRLKNAPEIEIWVTDISDEDGGLLSGLATKTVGDNCDMGDTYANRNIYNFERTGKHYDVPNVLEKMREE